ncbi:MAG: peptidoglycan-binding domain-containing protein [bacterium]
MANKIVSSLKKNLLTGTALALIIIPALSSADTLTRYLQLGAKGADVTSLQSFLAGDNTIYPQGKVTGYFGSLTKSAVSNYQVRNNIPTPNGVGAGRVGPSTMASINGQMNAGGINNGANVDAAIISLVSVATTNNNAYVSWNTNELAKGVVYYSTYPLSLTNETLNSIDISGSVAQNDNALRTSQSINLSGLQANTTYYYAIYTTDAAGNVSMTWPTSFKTSN